MLEETRLVLRHVVEQGGSVRDLLTTTLGFVNERTAPLYGLDGAAFGADLTPVELGPERPGVFTRLGFLSAFSRYEESSPILRGAFLLSEVQCVDVGAPPVGAASTPWPSDPELTNRERVEALTAPPECAACHVPFIDPLGFALESFDAVGQVQTTDNGAPIDTVATVMVYPDAVTVSGAAELMAALAESPRPALCYAQRWVEYAFAAQTGEHSCLADKLAIVLQSGSILDLVLETTQSEWFLGAAMSSPDAPTPTPAPVDPPAAPEPTFEPEPGTGGSDTAGDGGTTSGGAGTAAAAPKPPADGPVSLRDDEADAGSHLPTSDPDDERADHRDAGSRSGGDSKRVGVATAPEQSGCGCGLVGSSAPSALGWGWLVLFGAALRRRRRVGWF